MESKCTTRQRENKAGRIYGWQLHWRKASPRATFDITKSRRNFTTRLVLIFALVCAISVTSAIAQGAPQGGRLIVDRAPNFGWNLAVHLKIDGRAVADIVQGRHFEFRASGTPCADCVGGASHLFSATNVYTADRSARAHVRIYGSMGFGCRCSSSPISQL